MKCYAFYTAETSEKRCVQNPFSRFIKFFGFFSIEINLVRPVSGKSYALFLSNRGYESSGLLTGKCRTYIFNFHGVKAQFSQPFQSGYSIPRFC